MAVRALFLFKYRVSVHDHGFQPLLFVQLDLYVFHCPPPSPAPPWAALLPLLSRRAIMHAGKEVFVLDYQFYDQVQASLGAVSDNFRSNLQPVLDSLHTDPETKAALQSIISETSNSLDELARLISTSLTAASR